jgi:hypothetical protein
MRAAQKPRAAPRHRHDRRTRDHHSRVIRPLTVAPEGAATRTVSAHQAPRAATVLSRLGGRCVPTGPDIVTGLPLRSSDGSRPTGHGGKPGVVLNGHRCSSTRGYHARTKAISALAIDPRSGCISARAPCSVWHRWASRRAAPRTCAPAGATGRARALRAHRYGEGLRSSLW